MRHFCNRLFHYESHNLGRLILRSINVSNYWSKAPSSLVQQFWMTIDESI